VGSPSPLLFPKTPQTHCIFGTGMTGSSKTKQGATKKNKQTKATYLPTYILLRSSEILRYDFGKYFLWWFGLPMPHAEKRQKTRLKKAKGKDDGIFFPQLFRPKAFEKRTKTPKQNLKILIKDKNKCTYLPPFGI
jgi:hypothetical protein